MKGKKLTRARKITYVCHWVLMGLILAISVVGSIINKDASVKSIYVFNAVQAFLFLIVSFTPTILKKLQFEIPDVVYIVFVLFMSAHFFLGEICGFFAKISWWDSLLHTFSGFVLTFISFSLISLLNHKNENFKLNIWFTVLFAFSLTIAIGVLWEIIEFLADLLFGSNMQRAYQSIADGGARGEPLIGQAALMDTMKDLILDSIGSLCACALCVVLHKVKNISIEDMNVIKRFNSVKKEQLKQPQEEKENIVNNKNEIEVKTNISQEINEGNSLGVQDKEEISEPALTKNKTQNKSKSKKSKITK